MTIDYASPERIDCWLHHPVVGDPSFDAFVRAPQNPVVVGAPPYEWPVNGFLFIDPPTGDRYLYVGLYPRGYWPAGPCQCLVRRRGAETWENLGVVLAGSSETFDGDGASPGATPDVSVAYADGAYHMVYDWARRDGTRGGIAYARALHPAGPWVRAAEPIHVDAAQSPILGRYVRMYAATLLRRRRDWLILAMMSTPGNAGGTWALVGLVASEAAGPYGPPTLLLWPQSERFHPAPVEFYPAFARDGFAYAPATSVARNRSYQVLYRAPLERAHVPEAWEIARDGSCWHDEPVPHEAHGIWGQTFSAAIADDGTMDAMFPSRTADDVGTINLAARPFREPFRHGFVVSAPNAPALALLQRAFGDLVLDVEFAADALAGEAGGTLLWGHGGPVGPDRLWGADCALHPLCVSDCLRWDLAADGWRLAEVTAAGEERAIASGEYPERYGSPRQLGVRHVGDEIALLVSDATVWTGRVPVRRGRVGVLAGSGSIVKVARFIAPEGQPMPTAFLATEATMGMGCLPPGIVRRGDEEWELLSSPLCRWGVGARSRRADSAGKWNYRGRGFRLLMPRGPDLGACRVTVDGVDRGAINLRAAEPRASAAVMEDWSLPDGFHAVIVRVEDGPIILDALEAMPA